MAVIITEVILCLINILLWIILAIRFKKIFSTDDIIARTRNELNHMISDVNRNAERNITLIDEKIRELKAVSAEADRRITIVNSELAKKSKSTELQNKLNADRSKINPSSKPSSYGIDRYRKEQQVYLFSTVQDNQVPEMEIQSVPIITPQVYLSENPVEPKKDFNTLVKEKFQQGLTVDQIAAELGRSTQEVKFSLEFS